VEVLGRGQQFVAYGIHPATGLPFAWGEATPETTPLADLPTVTREQVAAFVEAAERLLRAAGYRTKTEIEAEAAPAARQPPAPRTNGTDRMNGAGRPAPGNGDASPFKVINDAAMRRPEAWVTALFPGARTDRRGVWRVTSDELGRNREEDISIAPPGTAEKTGIKDFGEHDVGDPREGKRTPIDLVMDHGGDEYKGDAKRAAEWLADRLGITVEIGRWARQATAKPATEATVAQSGLEWRRKLLQSDNGPIACEANVEIALRHAPELAGRLRFNELTGAAECSAPPWCRRKGWRAWTDNDDTALAVWCQHAGLRVKPATCAAAVQLVAADNPHHPVREYLDGLEWDGVPRLDSWLHTYLGVKVEEVTEAATDADQAGRGARNAYVRQVGRKWLISAVARAYSPAAR
jgi:hypothetical protein